MGFEFFGSRATSVDREKFALMCEDDGMRAKVDAVVHEMQFEEDADGMPDIQFGKNYDPVIRNLRDALDAKGIRATDEAIFQAVLEYTEEATA